MPDWYIARPCGKSVDGKATPIDGSPAPLRSTVSRRGAWTRWTRPVAINSYPYALRASRFGATCEPPSGAPTSGTPYSAVSVAIVNARRFIPCSFRVGPADRRYYYSAPA